VGLAWLAVFLVVVSGAVAIALLVPLPGSGGKAKTPSTAQTGRPNPSTSSSMVANVSPAVSTGPTVAPSTGAAFPTAADIQKANQWIAQRTGFLSYAVIDNHGHLSGWHYSRMFISASTPKAMMMVQYLRTHTTITAHWQWVIKTMIEYSDNNMADAVYDAIGRDAGINQVIQLAHMTHTVANRGFWGNCYINAADMARFFYNMDSYIPKAHLAFARYILSHIVRYPYGIPQVARPLGWKVFFKGGWRTGLHGPRLIHQIARLERSKTTLAIAILTDGELDDLYGQETLEGVTQRLLGAPTTN
jgi:hypothetical protein